MPALLPELLSHADVSAIGGLTGVLDREQVALELLRRDGPVAELGERGEQGVEGTVDRLHAGGVPRGVPGRDRGDRRDGVGHGLDPTNERPRRIDTSNSASAVAAISGSCDTTMNCKPVRSTSSRSRAATFGR